MRAVVQRVARGNVSVAGHEIGRTGPGLVILVCAMGGDTPAQGDKLASKISKLRIFDDDAGKMNLSLRDTGGSALVISQFTLAGDTSRGNRPGFSTAAAPALGKELYEHFVAALSGLGIGVETGEFGADMQVSLINDGPVTLWVEV